MDRLEKWVTPLRSLLAIAVMLAGIALAVDGRLDAIEERLLIIEIVSSADRWRASDQIEWTGALGVANPDLVVPDPGEILVRRHARERAREQP